MTIHDIERNVASLKKDEVKRILMVYEEKVSMIGDFCVRFNKLRFLKDFFNGATIDLNFGGKGIARIYESLLMNNPHLRHVGSVGWDAIEFEDYDVIFCISYDEAALLDHLSARYDRNGKQGAFRPVIFSMSSVMLAPVKDGRYIFPFYEALIDYVKTPRPGELYITAQEREWGDAWLRDKGMRDGQSLYIMLDSSSRRNKLLNVDVYFEVLKFLLESNDCMLLIFDENSLGKEEFYRAWLGEEHMKRLIVSKGLKLREDLCVIGSSFTKMIFGPCTGLMHCASSIFNNYVNNGLERADVPVLITYTGLYLKGENNANSWWGASPLVTCLLLKSLKGRRQIVELGQMTQEERDADDSLGCHEYTSEMLIDVVGRKMAVHI